MFGVATRVKPGLGSRVFVLCHRPQLARDLRCLVQPSQLGVPRETLRADDTVTARWCRGLPVCAVLTFCLVALLGGLLAGSALATPGRAYGYDGPSTVAFSRSIEGTLDGNSVGGGLADPGRRLDRGRRQSVLLLPQKQQTAADSTGQAAE